VDFSRQLPRAGGIRKSLISEGFVESGGLSVSPLILLQRLQACSDKAFVVKRKDCCCETKRLFG
jgi:hypothetical protein